MTQNGRVLRLAAVLLVAVYVTVCFCGSSFNCLPFCNVLANQSRRLTS
jgi:hypothetical protein